MVAGHTNGQNLTDVSLSTELFLYLGTVWAQIYMYKINVGESFIPIESGSAFERKCIISICELKIKKQLYMLLTCECIYQLIAINSKTTKIRLTMIYAIGTCKL